VLIQHSGYLLGRIQRPYFQCTACGQLCFQRPPWTLLDDAEAARLAVMASTGQLGESPADEVSCAFWRLLFGIAPPKSGGGTNV
jgi:hypothetical protein